MSGIHRFLTKGRGKGRHSKDEVHTWRPPPPPFCAFRFTWRFSAYDEEKTVAKWSLSLEHTNSLVSRFFRVAAESRRQSRTREEGTA